MNSKHYMNDRAAREELIKTIGYGKIIKTAIVDRGHKNGPEIHTISDTGIITVYNQITKKLVTRLIARPGQIARYYRADEKIPQDLMRLAREHQMMDYNNRQKEGAVKKITALFF